MCPILKDDIE